MKLKKKTAHLLLGKKSCKIQVHHGFKLQPCGAVLSVSGSSTTSQRRHVENKHPETFKKHFSDELGRSPAHSRGTSTGQ